MREIISTAAFRKDFKRLDRSSQHDLALLKQTINLLVESAALPEKYRDHPLGSNWNGYRECHIRPDWLLIYQLTAVNLTLVRTGSHSDLFG